MEIVSVVVGLNKLHDCITCQKTNLVSLELLSIKLVMGIICIQLVLIYH